MIPDVLSKSVTPYNQSEAVNGFMLEPGVRLPEVALFGKHSGICDSLPKPLIGVITNVPLLSFVTTN